MKFKSLFTLASLLLLISCEQGASDFATPTTPVQVTVADFSIAQGNFTDVNAAQSIADYSGVKAITLAFYTTSGTEVFKQTQLRADATTYTTFGTFSCSLPYGDYTLAVIGYGSTTAISLTSPTVAGYTDDKCRDTFVATQAVSVNNSTAINLNIVLSRIVSRLEMRSTDALPENVKKVNISFSKAGRDFNPTTGLAISDNGFTNSIDINSTVGNTCMVYSYLFLATDEETLDVSFTVLDANNQVILSKTIADVPFKRNRITTLSGQMFGTQLSTGFTVETDWLDGPTINF